MSFTLIGDEEKKAPEEILPEGEKKEDIWWSFFFAASALVRRSFLHEDIKSLVNGGFLLRSLGVITVRGKI